MTPAITVRLHAMMLGLAAMTSLRAPPNVLGIAAMEAGAPLPAAAANDTPHRRFKAGRESWAPTRPLAAFRAPPPAGLTIRWAGPAATLQTADACQSTPVQILLLTVLVIADRPVHGACPLVRAASDPSPSAPPPLVLLPAPPVACAVIESSPCKACYPLAATPQNPPRTARPAPSLLSDRS